MSEPIKRLFSMSYMKLYDECTRVAHFVSNDIQQFTEFGFNEDRLNDFISDIENFISEGMDDKSKLEQRKATNDKNRLHEELKTEIKHLRYRALMAFGKDANKIAKFQVKGLIALNDLKTLKLGQSLIKSARDFETELVEYGMTELAFVKFENIIEQFNTAIRDQSDSKTDRKISTQMRRERANDLFIQLRNICGVGQMIWHDSYAKQKLYKLKYRKPKSVVADD